MLLRDQPLVTVVGQAPGIPVVDPDELADRYWDLFTKRDRVEEIYPPLAASVLQG